MRILLVGAGASFSTKDVENGYRTALSAVPGVDLKYYALEPRIDLAREWLHKLWRARGRIPEQRPGWPDAIYRASIEAFEMALRFDVDWVLVISGMFFHGDVLEMMRRARLRTSVLFTESPYQDQEQSRLTGSVDVVWTTERSSAQALGAGYLRHAYDPERHHPAAADESVPAHDVVFVGTGFEERIEQLAAVDWTGIDLGLYGTWSLLGSRNPLRQYVRGGPMSNAQTVALYRRAKIGLNLHRTSQTYGRGVSHITWADSLNPRAYELAACGVFQISDYRAELREIFDGTVPSFHPDHLEDVLRAYLQDASARRYAAHQARDRVAPHTFAARAAQIVADLERSTDTNGYQVRGQERTRLPVH